jgi:hypothetical protein
MIFKELLAMALGVLIDWNLTILELLVDVTAGMMRTKAELLGREWPL